MNIETAMAGVLQERSALEQPEGIFSPTYISEHMQRLNQYTSALDTAVSDKEAELIVKEGQLFMEHIKTMSANAAKELIKYELAAERAEVAKIVRFVSNNWKIIGTAQSRVKHLVEEAKNTV